MKKKKKREDGDNGSRGETREKNMKMQRRRSVLMTINHHDDEGLGAKNECRKKSGP